MSLFHDQEVIETCSLHTAHEAFPGRIRVRCLVRDSPAGFVLGLGGIMFRRVPEFAADQISLAHTIAA